MVLLGLKSAGGMIPAMISILHPTVVELEQREESRRLAWQEARSGGMARYLFRPIPLRELRVFLVWAVFFLAVNCIGEPLIRGRKIDYPLAAEFVIAYFLTMLLGRTLVWIIRERKYKRLLS
jgi:hypothetical protein